MNIFQAAEQLIEEKLEMLGCEVIVGLDHLQVYRHMDGIRSWPGMQWYSLELQWTR